MTADGVPEIVPVELEMERPAGRDGETDQVTTVPPVEVGAKALMAVPLVNVNVVCE